MRPLLSPPDLSTTPPFLFCSGFFCLAHPGVRNGRWFFAYMDDLEERRVEVGGVKGGRFVGQTRVGRGKCNTQLFGTSSSFAYVPARHDVLFPRARR